MVADCEALVNREVSGMSGVSGTAVRLAYRAVRGSAARHVKAALPAAGALAEKYA